MTADAPAATKRRKSMSLSFLESAAFWAGVIAVACTALAAVAGIFAWYFSAKTADLKDAQLQQFQADAATSIAAADARAAEANEKAAEANRQAALANERSAKLEQQRLELLNSLQLFEGDVLDARARQDKSENTLTWASREIVTPRASRFSEEKFLDALKGKPTATAYIEYQPENPEAYLLAARIRVVLAKAGWQTTGPTPANSGGQFPSTPIGVAVHSNKLPTEHQGEVDTPYALLHGTLLMLLGGPFGSARDPRLPDNTFLVLVGPAR